MPDKVLIARIENIEKYLDRIVKLNQEIFRSIFQQPYSREVYEKRLEGQNPLVLVVLNAYSEEQVLGDLIAFPKDDSFHIWMMGVRGYMRRSGIGNTLLEKCEAFAQKEGFASTSVKTYNVSPEMQRLLLRREYLIRKLEENPKDPKLSIVHFSLDLEGRDYRSRAERLADARAMCKKAW